VPLGIGLFAPARMQLKVKSSSLGFVAGAHTKVFWADLAESPATISPTAAATSVPRVIFHCKEIGSLPVGEMNVTSSEPARPWGAVEGTIWKVCAHNDEQTTKMAKHLTMGYYSELRFGWFEYSVAHRLLQGATKALYLRPMLAAVLLVVCPCGFPATLSVANQTANPGQTVAAPVLLAAGGQAIAAVQFDLQWDQALAVQVAPGSALGQAFKVLYTASAVSGSIRCLIVGVNQNSLADGAVIELFVTIGNNSSLGTAQMSLTNAMATSPDGVAIPLQSVSASVQIQNGTTLALPAASVLNGASLLSGSAAPGEIITLLGSFPLSPAVLFNGIPAPVIYAGSGQVNAIVPFGMNLGSPVDIQVLGQNQVVGNGSLPVAAVAPAIFTQSGTGAGPGAALNQDFSLNTPSNPAAPNSILMVYGTGFGLLQSTVSDGQIVTAPVPLVLPVSATIGGMPAAVLYAGAAPALIAGLTQINIQVPQGLPSNPYSSIMLSIGEASTPPGVTVSIR
jgi:uncharacterized protein (TIGR03437 family)